MASFLLTYLLSASELLPLSLVPLIFYDLCDDLVPGFPGKRSALMGGLNDGCMTSLRNQESGAQQIQQQEIDFWSV